MKPAAMNDNTGMGTVRFLTRCSDQLKLSGKEEASFYFEQLVDHLRSGGSLNENQDVSRVLGL